MEANELHIISKYSIWQQYRIIYHDGCYMYLSIATSLNYGLMVSVVFLLHQNAKAWDSDKVY